MMKDVARSKNVDRHFLLGFFSPKKKRDKNRKTLYGLWKLSYVKKTK